MPGVIILVVFFLGIFSGFFTFFKAIAPHIRNERTNKLFKNQLFISIVLSLICIGTLQLYPKYYEQAIKPFVDQAPQPEVNIEGEYIGDYFIMDNSPNSKSILPGHYRLSIRRINDSLTCQLQEMNFNDTYQLHIKTFDKTRNWIEFEKLGNAKISINRSGTLTVIKSDTSNFNHKFKFEKYENKLPANNYDF